jgi:hypothetical protein
MDGNKRTAFWVADEYLKDIGVTAFTTGTPDNTSTDVAMPIRVAMDEAGLVNEYKVLGFYKPVSSRIMNLKQFKRTSSFVAVQKRGILLTARDESGLQENCTFTSHPTFNNTIRQTSSEFSCRRFGLVISLMFHNIWNNYLQNRGGG